MKKFFYLAVTVLLLTGTNAGGQSPAPVLWSFSAQHTNTFEIRVTITAVVAPGWHMYSQFSDQDGPQPAQFIFDTREGYTPVGRPEEKGQTLTFYDSLYEMNITWLSGKVSFLQTLTRTKPVSRITGRIEYMVCNDHMCIPEKREFAVAVPEKP